MYIKIKSKFINASLGKMLFQVLMVFFFIYEVQPIGVPDLLTSRKLVFYISAFLFLYKRDFKFSLIKDNKFVNKTLKLLLCLSIGMLMWVIVLIVWNNFLGKLSGESILSRTLLFIPFSGIIYLFIYDLFDNVEQFLHSVYIATLLQSSVVITHYFSQSMKVFLYNNFVLDANFTYLSPYRAAGLGAGESLLSMNLFVGLVACAYGIMKKRHIAIYVIGYAIILFSALLSGSTGFLAGIILFVSVTVFLFFEERNFKGLSIICLAIIALVIMTILMPDFFATINEFEIFRKISDFWTVGMANSSIVTSLQAQQIAPITSETIIGTSLYRGYSATGLFSRSDTGYLQAYFGYGLVGAVIFYICLYRDMIRNILSINNKKMQILLCMFLVVIIAGEAKEPYIHHYGILFVFYMICLLWHKTTKSK